MGYLFINSVCGFLCENLFILRLQIYINVTKKIAFLGFKDISVAECAFLSSLVSLNPITVAFGSLAMKRISSVLGRRLFIFK